MTVADYVVDYLIHLGVTDIFGIPGGVVLRFLEAAAKREPEIVPHLNYHEQTAGFAACGYAQSKHGLGVAYATRGPGITNMFTCLMEAYQESLPVLFITSHGKKENKSMRFEYDQEVDLTQNFKKYTKYAASIEKCEDVEACVEAACRMAMEGRKGPVYLDVSSGLWNKEYNFKSYYFKPLKENLDYSELILKININLADAERPIILIGDGIRQANAIEKTRCFLKKLNIPILSSRASQDIVCDLETYYGYVGSHACRYSNFILSKADLIISIGNRLSFPADSDSFRPIIEHTHIIRIDIDQKEFQRTFPSVENYCVDVFELIDILKEEDFTFRDSGSWNKICSLIKEKLNLYDISQPVKMIGEVLKRLDVHSYVCDVGNNEYWFSRAYECIKPKGQVLYSKSFGTLGCSIGKAIGAYYATKDKIMCVVGDQGFQYNIQELQYVSYWNIPIIFLLVNNNCSGMIRDSEKKLLKNQLLHVSSDTGYSVPDFESVVQAYGIKYVRYNEDLKIEINGPLVLELQISEEICLTPILPIGNKCNDMLPAMDAQLYNFLERL